MRQLAIHLFLLWLLTACGIQNQAIADLTVTPGLTAVEPTQPLKASSTPLATFSPTAIPSATPSLIPTIVPTATPTPLPWGRVEISEDNAGEIVQLASWGRGEVLRYEITQTGQILVLSTLGFYLYRSSDHALLAEIPDAVQFLLSPNQDYSAIRLLDGRVVILENENGGLLYEIDSEAKLPQNFCPKCSPVQLQQYSDYYHSTAPMRFSQDQSRFAFAAIDGAIFVWDLKDGTQIVRLYHDSAGMDEDILFTPDGKNLISNGRQPIAYVRYSSISFWSIEEEKLLWYIKESGRLDERLFSPDGNVMGVLQGVAGLKESVISLFRVKDGTFVGLVNGEISDQPFSPDSSHFISFHSNNVLFWKIQPEFVLLRTLYPVVEVKLAEISEDATHLEINGGELSYLLSDFQVITQGTANLPELEPVEEISVEEFSRLGHLNQINGMLLTKDQQILVWGGNQNVWRWNPLTGAVDWVHFETEPMSQPVLSADGEKVAACSKENLYIAGINEAAIFTFERCLQKGILAFSPIDAALAYGYNTQLQTINPLDGQTIQGFYGSGYPITWLEYAHDGRFLASGGEICSMTCQGDLRLWDVENIKGISLESDGSEWPVTDVVFSSDSQLMIGAKEFVWVWNTGTGKLQGRFPDKGKKIALSPDDQILAIADLDGFIHLMRMSDRTEVYTWQTDQRGIKGLAFTSDGKSLLSLADDGSLMLWGMY